MDVDSEDGASDGGDNVMSFESLVNNAVKYIVSIDESNFPIKRADIAKNVLPPKSGKRIHNIMEEVKQLLDQTFGLELVDLDGTNKTYVTVSKFTQPQSVNLFSFSMEYRRKRSLLLIVLSYIYMMDNSVSEDNLWKFLMKLKLVDRTVNHTHPFFGNVRRIVTTDFIRHMYLKIDKEPGANTAENTFTWGPRADVEFNKMDILKFVAKMQGNIGPERLTAHWSKLHKEENDVATVNDTSEKRPVKEPAKRSQRPRRK